MAALRGALGVRAGSARAAVSHHDGGLLPGMQWALEDGSTAVWAEARAARQLLREHVYRVNSRRFWAAG